MSGAGEAGAPAGPEYRPGRRIRTKVREAAPTGYDSALAAGW